MQPVPPMKTGSNAIDLLKRQHAEVRDLFTQIEEESDDDEKLELVQELADVLNAHAAIEEKLFYPVAYANVSEDMHEEAVDDHRAIRRLVAELCDMSPDDDDFEEKLDVLRAQVEEHVKEEESEIFPAVRQSVKAPELKQLGEEMQQLFAQELKGVPSVRVPSPPAHQPALR